jgi:thiamine biosynthesis lipoprotein
MNTHHRYTHEAMKTTFTLHLDADDPQLARQVAHACIARIDAIEATLSRYLCGSDVWQINHMQRGETRYLSEDCYACLRIALDAQVQSGGLFDITLGRQIEHRKNQTAGPAPQLCGQLMVDPDRPAIHCIEAGREIDLGGIGKGFALDRIQALAQDWGIQSGLIAAGASTQLAFGPERWDIQLRGDHAQRTISLSNQALSASGIGIQGSHIVSPDPDRAAQYTYPRIWLTAPTAALADAWSTAALLMSADELQQLPDPSHELFIETHDGTAIERITGG